MNYRKLISRHLSGAPNCTNDRSAAAVALLAGLAVGAVLGILFAPDSGRRTRERISDKALGVADNVKDSFHTLKDKLDYGKESLVGLKDHVVDNVKTKANAVSQEFKDFRDTELNKSKSDLKDIEDGAGEPT